MRRLLAAATALVLGLLTGCSAAAGQTTPATTRLVVFAAASLSDAYTALGRTFEASHPGVSVTFSFDGSSTLVDQLKAGAPADVFASADRATMDKATTANLLSGTPTLFATNTLTLIVPAGNPARITGLDASLDGTKLVVCAEGVPCGSATTKLAARLGVTLKPVSQETKVTDVRAKVETGQADAGIVYVTDAKASGSKVETIPIPGAEAVRNDYLVGVVATSTQAALASAFVSLVTGPQGRAALTSAGFATP
ncbi:MAG TPA: molybdate ABC transporter substrate-binding protein [Propionibacteriaceae bacterium]|nr:molybdate ABC transporter substrate-binding protein [Propionibacteriaceae bacterium]